MQTFSELNHRLSGLSSHLDGELWDSLISGLDPPQTYAPATAAEEMAFRDAKALAGYVPDLRHIMSKHNPTKLDPAERRALDSVYGFYNLAARIPVLLLSMELYRDTEQLIDLYNGFRQVLVELKRYRNLSIKSAEEEYLREM